MLSRAAFSVSCALLNSVLDGVLDGVMSDVTSGVLDGVLDSGLQVKKMQGGSFEYLGRVSHQVEVCTFTTASTNNADPCHRWLTGSLAHWFTGSLAGSLVHWLTGWLVVEGDALGSL